MRYSAGAVQEGVDIADQDTRLGCYRVVGATVDPDSLRKAVGVGVVGVWGTIAGSRMAENK